jgi:hypothetical protein
MEALPDYRYRRAMGHAGGHLSRDLKSLSAHTHAHTTNDLFPALDFIAPELLHQLLAQWAHSARFPEQLTSLNVCLVTLDIIRQFSAPLHVCFARQERSTLCLEVRRWQRVSLLLLVQSSALRALQLLNSASLGRMLHYQDPSSACCVRLVKLHPLLAPPTALCVFPALYPPLLVGFLALLVASARLLLCMDPTDALHVGPVCSWMP